ncbi:MAG TPA: FtsX-like permease family protein, partial [Pseudomonadales bacterium]|nr:FtsX-like permease family protein [Pseudomonadales bacterium]
MKRLSTTSALFPAHKGGELILRSDSDQYYWDNVFLADENIFDILQHEIIYGDPTSALKDPLAIAISASMSKRYFGESNPIGETLSTDTAAYQVTLVFADPPANTHLKYPALLSYNRLKAFFGDTPNISQALWNISDYTYLKIQPDVKPADFKAISEDFFSRYMSENAQQFNSNWRFFIEPLAGIHLNSKTTYDEPRGNRFYVYVFSSIACFVLLIACINYMNLETARSVSRAREIGMRKIIGAHKEQIVMQFLSESLVFTFLSLIIALGLTYLVAEFSPISSLLGKPLEFDIFRPELLAFILALGLAVSLISGMY